MQYCRVLLVTLWHPVRNNPHKIKLQQWNPVAAKSIPARHVTAYAGNVTTSGMSLHKTKNCPDLYPMATHGIDSEKNHIVLRPMENRHSHVYELLLKRNILKDILYLVGWMIKGIVHCILLQCLQFIIFAHSLCCIWEIK